MAILGVSGFCHYCKKMHDVHSVTNELVTALIAEGAQRRTDYYRMDNHVDTEGEPCQGADTAPEWLKTGVYSEEFLDHLDDFEEEFEDPEEKRLVVRLRQW